MKFFSKCILLTILLTTLVNKSFAGLLIEPYLGLALNGDGEYTKSGDKGNQDYSSFTYGGRLGYSTLGLMAGLDYSRQSFDLTTKETGSVETKDGVDKSQLGLFVGYKFPVMLKVWGTYFFNGTVEGNEIDNGNRFLTNLDKFEDGSGYGLGVGFTALPFISLNLEYRNIEYSKISSNGVNEANKYTEKPNLSEILLSVSAPFNLF